MAKKCVLCEENILEEFGKLIGTLIKAKDAIELDTTDLSIDEQVNYIINIVN